MRMWQQPRVALVTAASLGIGREVARMLAAEGAHVAICARGEDALAEAAQEIGGDVLAIRADIVDATEAEKLVAAVIAHFGRIDILVANGGGPSAGQTLDHDDAQWRAAFDMVALAPLRLARLVVPGMMERNWGRIITISSISVREPLASMALSNSTRLAALGWSKSLAQELAVKGITVNSVCPGWTRTRRVEQVLAARAVRQHVSAAELETEIITDIPMQRLLDPAEVAAAVTFLASDHASGITGVALPVDGGVVAGY